MTITGIKTGIAKETILRASSKEPGKGVSEFSTLLTNQIYNKNISNSMFSNNRITGSPESNRAIQGVIIGTGRSDFRRHGSPVPGSRRSKGTPDE